MPDDESLRSGMPHLLRRARRPRPRGAFGVCVGRSATRRWGCGQSRSDRWYRGGIDRRVKVAESWPSSRRRESLTPGAQQTRRLSIGKEYHVPAD
jgi:hypothetical protein